MLRLRPEARDTQLEENTEKNIQEAVETERRPARALNKERRRIHSEGFERRLKDELLEEIRLVNASTNDELAETRAEWSFRQESTAVRGSGGVFPPQGPPSFICAGWSC